MLWLNSLETKGRNIMLTSIFAANFSILDASVSTSLTDAIQSVYGFSSDFASEDFFDISLRA